MLQPAAHAGPRRTARAPTADRETTCGRPGPPGAIIRDETSPSSGDFGPSGRRPAAALASGSTSGRAELVSNLITPLGFLAFVACFAVAVLKYRLYEIDRIISRVISYAIITALLAGIFAGLVVLATVVLPFKSSVGVAAATLAAAALFNPLRTRVQHAVDRRFNRTRYSADQAVAAFAARLKDAVDLDSVRDDLVGVVNQTLEPAHISVWVSHRG